MITYTVLKKNDTYNIYSNDKLLYKAIRSSSWLFSEKVTFYDSNERKILYSKQKYFLFLDFGHRIKFVNQSEYCYMKARNGNTELYYEGNLYAYRHNLISRDKSLLVNGNIVGEFGIIKVSRLEFEHYIACDNEEFCFIFSIMDILLDWFDVN